MQALPQLEQVLSRLRAGVTLSDLVMVRQSRVLPVQLLRPSLRRVSTVLASLQFSRPRMRLLRLQLQQFVSASQQPRYRPIRQLTIRRGTDPKAEPPSRRLTMVAPRPEAQSRLRQQVCRVLMAQTPPEALRASVI